MSKKELIKMKKSLLALGVAGTLIGSTGCGKKVETINADDNVDLVSVPKEYYNFDEYCKYVIKDDEPVREYNSENIVLYYNKETYDVSEYLFNTSL